MRSAAPHFRRVMFVLPPTGRYCREDRCQSYFAFELIPSMRPPLEEAEAAAGVRLAGGEPLLLDAPAEGLDVVASLSRVQQCSPDLVVLSVTFGSLKDDLAFAAALRERLPGLTIALRGAPCFTDAEALLQANPAVDFLARGDYERVFESLLRDGVARAEGVVSRERAGPPPLDTSLDALPLPDRSVLKPALYRVRGTRRPQATVHVQRGCPFPCSYCLVATVSGRKARHRSPQGIAAEMRALWDEGYRDFYLRAETLTLDRAWARELAGEIAREVPGARWVSTTRVDCVDEPLLHALAAGGCYGLTFGVETGSPSIGQRIHKPPDEAQTRAAFRACDKSGITSLLYVMLGFLWETPRTVEETGRFVQAVRPDLLTLNWAHPYPGTRYYEEVKRSGLAFRPERAQAAAALEPPGISLRALRRSALALTARHYLRPAVVASLARKLGPVLLPGAGLPGPRSLERSTPVRA